MLMWKELLEPRVAKLSWFMTRAKLEAGNYLSVRWQINK